MEASIFAASLLGSSSDYGNTINLTKIGGFALGFIGDINVRRRVKALGGTLLFSCIHTIHVLNNHLIRRDGLFSTVEFTNRIRSEKGPETKGKNVPDKLAIRLVDMF